MNDDKKLIRMYEEAFGEHTERHTYLEVYYEQDENFHETLAGIKLIKDGRSVIKWTTAEIVFAYLTREWKEDV